MSEWITGRPPTVDEVGNADVCLIADEGGDPFIYSGKSAREAWRRGVTAWMPILPYVPPEPEISERVWVWKAERYLYCADRDPLAKKGIVAEYRRVVRAKRGASTHRTGLGKECSICGYTSFPKDHYCAGCGAEFDN